MYLSSRARVPPPPPPPTVTSSPLTGGTATLSVSRSFHTLLPSPSFSSLSLSFFHSRLSSSSSSCSLEPYIARLPFPHLYAQQRSIHLRTSLHATSPRVLFPSFYVLTHDRFFSFRAFHHLHHVLLLLLLLFALSLLHSYTGHAYKRHGGIPTPSIVASSVLRVLSPTSPLAYCFREFDEILPRDANGPDLHFFRSTRQLVIWS